MLESNLKVIDSLMVTTQLNWNSMWVMLFFRSTFAEWSKGAPIIINIRILMRKFGAFDAMEALMENKMNKIR